MWTELGCGVDRLDCGVDRAGLQWFPGNPPEETQESIGPLKSPLRTPETPKNLPDQIGHTEAQTVGRGFSDLLGRFSGVPRGFSAVSFGIFRSPQGDTLVVFMGTQGILRSC